jgi:L-fuconolactonase
MTLTLPTKEVHPVIVDAHQHLWTADYEWLADPDLAVIRRRYTIRELRAANASASIDAGILVEAGRMRAEETTHMLTLAAESREILGVVGWASLTDPGLEETIGKHRAGSGGHLLVGIRDRVEQQADDHLDRADVRAGLRTVAAMGLVNELVVRIEQLPAVARVAAAIPEARFVLDHLGRPWVGGGADALAEWRALIEPVAAHPNVTTKLSGLVTEADWQRWSVDHMRPYVDGAVDLFGPSRLMFGSDWPVCELAATCAEVTRAMMTLLGGVSADVFGRTAQRVYQLDTELA